VIFLVAALAALWSNDWGLRSYCVPMNEVFDKVPANGLDLDKLGPS
jgi:hypothetical protein